MNILILTGKFGMGHVKCAEAISEEIHASNADASITTVDVMDYLFPHFSKAIYKGFSLLVSRLPGMYNHLNRAAGKHTGVPMRKTIASKLDKLMAQTEPDLIISNLPVCSKYISAYKELRVCPQPLFTYITDITVHDEWIADKTDMYFVGDESTKNTLVSKGVPAEKVGVSGIPVSHRFKVGTCSADYPQNHAGGIKNGSGRKKGSGGKNDGGRVHLLIMGGGLGLVPGGSRLLKILNNEDKLDVTLIAGKNHRLEKHARRKYENINVIGYTDKVYDYMAKADLIITKPGGITTFEAIASQTPMYIVDPFLEQEMGNALFIESKNIGRVVNSNETDIAADLIKIAGNRILLETMKDNMKKLSASLASPDPLAIRTGGSPEEKKGPAIMLTFDDGPDPSYTGQLLDLLDSHGIKAAFFTLGNSASANPELIQRMAASGHTVGIHSYSHRSAYLMSAAQVSSDMDQAVAALQQLGINPRFYRPPWGHTTRALVNSAKSRCLMPVYWSVMAQDWQGNMSTDEIASRLLKRTWPGSIVCLHDGRGKKSAPTRTIAALEKVLPLWLEKGYRFVLPEEVYGP